MVMDPYPEPDQDQTPKTVLLFASPLRFIDQTEGVLIYAAPMVYGRLPARFPSASRLNMFSARFPFAAQLDGGNGASQVKSTHRPVLRANFN